MGSSNAQHPSSKEYSIFKPPNRFGEAARCLEFGAWDLEFCSILLSTKWSGHPFFRSYGARLPSSLTRFHSRALAKLCPPTCVGFRYGQPWEHTKVFLGFCFNGSASAEASTSLPSYFQCCHGSREFESIWRSRNSAETIQHLK